MGYWTGQEDVLRNREIDRVFYPSVSPQERQRRLKGWSEAVRYACGWAKEDVE